MNTEITAPRKKLLVGMGSSLAALSMFVYLYQYSQPDNLPTVLQQGQALPYIAHFLFRLLGYGMGCSVECSLSDVGFNEVAGIVIFLIWCASILWLIRDWNSMRHLQMLVQWAIIGLYGLGTGVMVAFARSNLGLLQACSPRYIGFTEFLSISALVFPILLYYNGKRDPNKRMFVFLAVALIFLSTGIRLTKYQSDYARLEWFGAKIARAKAGLLLSESIPFALHQELIYPSGFPALQKKARWLNTHGYIRPNILQHPYLEPNQMEATMPAGIFSQLTVDADSITAHGIVDHTLIPLLRHAVVVTIRQTNGRRKIAVMDNSGKHNWTIRMARYPIENPPAELEAWLLNADTGLFLPLNGTHSIEN